MQEEATQPHVQRLDKILLLALGGLMLFGIAFVLSATRSNEIYAEASLWRQPFFKQVVFYTIGLGAATVLCLRDYHSLARYAFVFYWICIAMLVVVLIPGIGAERYGARRWFDLGITQFQPSELAKVAFLLAMAQFLSRPREELQHKPVLLKGLGLAALPFGLILLEPDLGSSLMIMPAALAMLYVAGAPASFLKRLVGGAAGFILLALAYVFFVPQSWKPVSLPDYQKRRLMVYFGVDYTQQYAKPNATRTEIQRIKAMQRRDSYNVAQAMISVGSGGISGKGWGEGIQNAHGYLPRGVSHNDFIFSVIAEESGFVGSALVIGFYSIILMVGIRVAGQARDRLGRLLAVGVVVLLFSHVFVNIGMNIRLVPVTGVPLPLLSYGGTSIVCSLVAIGFLQNIQLHQRSI
ncbi:MAG: cell cycle protein [Verrucomicrobiales bacterium]|nr:cell cycle protein [Verrucomicrobiales bacterium]